MGYRTTVLRTWGNVVGRDRAVAGVNQFIERAGGVAKAAETLGMSATTLRKLRRYFEGLPAREQLMRSRDPLDQALEAGESSTVEFKEAMPSQARDLAKEVAALATSGGGLILIGVADDHTIVGFDDSRERVEGVMQLVSPSPPVRVELHERRGRRLCAIIVEGSDEPVYCVDSRPYMRDGSLSRPARHDKVVSRIRAKLAGDTAEAAAIVNLPTFEGVDGAIGGLETAFQPSWRIA